MGMEAKFVAVELPMIIGLVGFVFLIAAALLFLSYAQQRQLAPLGLWSLSFGLAAVGMLLLAGRGKIDDFWSIVVANALICSAYGVMWMGARRLDQKPFRPFPATAGSAIWLVAMLIPSVETSFAIRSALVASIGTAYTLLTVAELWRSRRNVLPSRWPAIVLLIVHVLAMPLRVPAVATSLGASVSSVDIFAFVVFEAVLMAMAGAYLFGSLVKEQVAATYRRAASVDVLTGVENRRGFLQQGQRMLQRAAIEGTGTALLVFDIDHFKKINDTYGHAVGDAVLISFCELARAQIRPRDIFARIGGEEFACLLYDASAADALNVAERIRFAFGAAQFAGGARTFSVTVSVGVATSKSSTATLPDLLGAADRALYRAKRGGRNRIEIETGSDSPAPQSLVARTA